MTHMALSRIISVDDFQAEARRTLDKGLYEYLASGTDDEVTLSENRASFSRISLSPRFLRNVNSIDTSLTLRGMARHRFTMPIFISPAGVHRLCDPEGEGSTARACQKMGVAIGISQHATSTIEEVATVAPDSCKWYQAYITKDRRITADLVRRAIENGYSAIVLTVDSPVFGAREADARNHFNGLPDGLSLVNYHKYTGKTAGSVAAHFDDRKEAAWDQNTEKMFDRNLGWGDVTWLKGLCGDLPLYVKGILRADDAIESLKAGADGIIVSNHGGRQLDGCLGAVDALPSIAAAVEAHRSTVVDDKPHLGRIYPVFLDGGVRRGTDVIKAIALGADAVLLGKPMFFALAVGGETGVRRLLEILEGELRSAMALCGCASLDEIRSTPNLVLVRNPEGPGAIFLRPKL